MFNGKWKQLLLYSTSKAVKDALLLLSNEFKAIFIKKCQ